MGKLATSIFAAAAVILSSGTFSRASDTHPSSGTLLAFFGGGSKDKSPLKKKQRERARATLSTLEKEAHLVLFTDCGGPFSGVIPEADFLKRVREGE